MIKFDNVITGLINYANENLLPGMNDLQEIGARLILAEIYERREVLKAELIKNGVVKTFGIMDSDGDLDIERLMNRLKTEIQNKGKLEISVPMYGKFIFKPEDIDMIYEYISKGATE